jgi:effector-binding domain-containing protein
VAQNDQVPAPEDGGREWTGSCELVRSNAMVVAAYSYDGPGSGISGAFDYLLDWAKARHVEAFGPLVGVYHDPDHPGDPVRVDAWLPLDPGLRNMEAGDRDVKIKDIPPRSMVQITYRGFPGDMGAAFERIWAFLSERGLQRAEKCHRQVYTWMPVGAPDDAVIEIQLPVESDWKVG